MNILNYLQSFHFWMNAAQVLVIVIGIWIFYKRFIKGTVSESVVHGLVGLGIMWLTSWITLALDLEILGTTLRFLAMFLSIGLVVIFQPELRKFLALMGQIKFLRAIIMPRAFKDISSRDKISKSAQEITKAVEYMSNQRTGALIVFVDSMGGGQTTGTRINADISSELIMTIFFDKTPLHDGAMVIGRNRILSAGVILPLTDKSDLAWRYGTRHRAAIGMSESSDSVVLVVSEETGTVSIAHGGKLKKYDDMKKLSARIEGILSN